MGNGCTTTKVGSCPPNDRLSSNCIIWQGDPFPQFGICTGDTITEVTETILNKLIEFSKGEGIFLTDLVAGCEALEVKLKATDYSLYSIVKLILEHQCTIEDAIAKLKKDIEKINKVSVDTTCLSATPVTTREGLDQLIIDTVCDNKSKIETLLGVETDTDTGETVDITAIIQREIATFLEAKLKSCNGAVEKVGSGTGVEFNIISVPVRSFVYGDFDLSNFDATGLGKGNYCNYAIANGLNGTIDMRDYAIAMLNTVSGVPRTFNTTQTANSTAGTVFSRLHEEHLPPHIHNIPLNQKPHKHRWFKGDPTIRVRVAPGTFTDRQITVYNESSATNEKFTTEDSIDISVGTITTPNAKATTFENRQPTRYVVCIQRIK